MGGNTGSNSNVTEEYDGTSWSAGGNLGTGRYRLAGAGTQSAGLRIGGLNDAADTEHYDGTSWSAGSDLGTGRGSLAGCGTQSAALCMGGTDHWLNGSLSNVTEEYNRDPVEHEDLFSASGGL